MNEFDFKSVKNRAIEQLKASKLLLGKDGAFVPLLESRSITIDTYYRRTIGEQMLNFVCILIKIPLKE